MHYHRILPLFISLTHSTSRLRLYSQAAIKSPLAKLRKSTGLPFSLCREALQKNNNDLDMAFAWLKEEAVSRGLSKSSKLSGRNMSEGLLGVLSTLNQALILEVNCESDFVARNTYFQNFVVRATEAAMKHFSPSMPRLQWSSEQLGQLMNSDSETLNDLLASTVLSTGENISLRRAFGLSLIDDSSCFAVYSHMSIEDIKQGISDVQFGKYAAIIRYRPVGNKPIDDGWHERAARSGKQICQHIVGMNPNPNLEPTGSPSADSDEEKQLLWQPFLLDESIKVGDYLERNHMILEEFVRVQCGQNESGDLAGGQANSSTPTSLPTS